MRVQNYQQWKEFVSHLVRRAALQDCVFDRLQCASDVCQMALDNPEYISVEFALTVIDKIHEVRTTRYGIEFGLKLEKIYEVCTTIVNKSEPAFTF